MEYPSWVNAPGLTDAEIESNRLNFMIKLAALHHNKRASVRTMANAAGTSREALFAAVTRGFLTTGTACAIESVVGKHIAPKHLLCPAKFSE